MKIFNFLRLGYLMSIIGLFFYSFTQVDLSLTLSQWSVWQVMQKAFQQIGYFQRPLSAVFYLSIVLLLYLFYSLILLFIHKNKISAKKVWFTIILTTLILTFSYNAFSYDLFNYIFDAKIVTYYHQNPYLHKALDFPGDRMLSFMHWTHRLYPYGPVWLFLTVPLSFFGMQYFLPTFFLFKILVSLSFLGTVFFISRILRKVSPQNEIFCITFFALNPLVIIESLVSAHNDIVMMMFAMGALYSLMNKVYIRSLILLILSIGVKFASVFLIPVFLLIYFFNIHKIKLSWDKIFVLIAILMSLAVVLASIRTNFQPWYLLYVLPFAALISKKYYIVIPGFVISIFSVLEYLPFLYLGNWDMPVPLILSWMTMSSLIVSAFLVFIYFFKQILVRRN